MFENAYVWIVKGENEWKMNLTHLNLTYAPQSFYNWNVEGLKDYLEQLKAEIARIDEILATIQDVSAQAEALFKS